QVLVAGRRAGSSSRGEMHTANALNVNARYNHRRSRSKPKNVGTASMAPTCGTSGAATGATFVPPVNPLGRASPEGVLVENDGVGVDPDPVLVPIVKSRANAREPTAAKL